MKQLYFKSLFIGIFFLLSITAKAYSCKVDGIYYNLDKPKKTASVTYLSTIKSTNASAYKGSVIIPSSFIYDGTTYKVIRIEFQAFYGCDGLISIDIPNSVTSVANQAFEGCSNLTTVIINSNATLSNDYSFDDIKLKNKFGSQVTEYIIGEDVKRIGERAFQGCSSLTSITIPNSMTSIGSFAFMDCPQLSKVNISEIGAWCNISFEDNPLKYARHLYLNGQLVTNLVIPSSVSTIGKNTFNNCSDLSSVTIPNSVTTIGEGAFSGCSGLTSVTIPNSVTTIGSYAFNGCSGLTSVTIPNSVTSIGEYAFRDCSGLSSISIPSSLLSIGNLAFDSCNKLKTVTINSNTILSKTYSSSSNLKNIFGSQVTKYILGADVTRIGNYAFYGCSSLTSISIPKSMAIIGNYAFSGCGNLKTVTINSNTILSQTYSSSSNLKNIFGSQVTKYTIGEDVTGIGKDVFSGCSSLTSVTISNSVTWIGENAFKNCSGLTSMTIPNSVTSIGKSAFQDCSGLTSVSISNNVTWIGNYVFSGCSGLFTVTIPKSVTAIGNSAFSGCSGLTDVTIPNSVTTIGSSAFYRCSGLTSVTIPNSVTTIGSYAFNGCSGLTSVTIPNSVTSIGEYAFRDCSGLSSISIPSSLLSIGNLAFDSCNKLKTVTINSNTILSKTYSSSSNLKNIFGSQVTKYILGSHVTTIGNYAFSGCSGLTSVTIPNSVTTIGGSAFNGCSGLTSVTIPNSVTSIGSYAFYGCSDLSSVTIPNSVTTIGNSAFSGCIGLESIVVDSGNTVYDSRNNCNAIIETATNTLLLGCERTNIPNSVSSIGDNAFSGCSGLTSITIPNSVTSIGFRAFADCYSMITLPNNVTYIGTDAFYQCTSLFVKKGTVSLLSCWNSGYTPLQIGTENELNKPYVEIISTTQTTATLKLINEYSEYTYTDNGGRKITPKGGVFTITGLRPEVSNNYYIKVSLGDVYYTTSQISFNTKNISPSVRRTGYTASSVTVSGSYIAGDASVTSQKLTLNGMSAEGNSHTFTGLDPNKSYTAEYSITVAYGQGYTSTYRGTINVSTNELSLTTSQPKVISAGNVIVAAESNLDDEETNVGFEWRRIDYTSEFPSYTGTAYLYNGTMEGYIRSLYTEKLWKYRPYYTSNAGNTYYGEWMGIDPTNTSYFEPTVHTYANVSVNGNSAEVKGYVQRGTDNVVSKGFAYWEQPQGVKSREAMSAPSMISSLPSNAKTVEVSGSQQVMTASLSNLEYETTYCYVAFVRTSEGDTFYGEEMTFTSGESPYTLGDVNGDKEIDISDVVAMVNHILGSTSSTSFKPQAADINKDSNIDISDVVALVNMILGQ